MPYPNSLDSLPTNHVDPPAPGSPEKIAAAIVNNIAAAINAIEQELGLNPGDVYADVATRLNTMEYFVFNSVPGSTYTLSTADQSKVVVCTASAGCTITVPNNTAVPFRDGASVTIRAASTGLVTVVGAAGVTIVNPFNSFQLAAQNAEAKLMKIGTNAWSLNGEVV